MNKALLIPTVTAALLASPETAETKPPTKTPAFVANRARYVQETISAIQEKCFLTIQTGEIKESWGRSYGGHFSFSDGKSTCECDSYNNDDTLFCEYTEPNEEISLMFVPPLNTTYNRNILMAGVDNDEGEGCYISPGHCDLPRPPNCGYFAYADGDKYAFVDKTKTPSFQIVRDLILDGRSAFDFIWETACEKLLDAPLPKNYDLYGYGIPEECDGL